MIVFRSVKGSQLTSEEVDGNFQYLLGQSGASGLMVAGEYTHSGLNLNMSIGWGWKLFGLLCSNASAFAYTAASTTGSNRRVDIAVGDAAGNISILSGPSGLVEVDPPIPNDKAKLLRYVVQGSAIVDIGTVLGGYIKKSGWINIPEVVGGNPLAAVTELNRNFIVNAYSGSGKVTGFIFGLMSAMDEATYPGQIIKAENKSEVNITLEHDTAVEMIMKFWFPNLVDYVWKPNEILTFAIRNGQAALVSSSLGGEVDLSGKLDKVTSGDEERVYSVGSDNSQQMLPVGVPLGLAKYDMYGKIPIEALPNSVMTLEGNWDASTNTPTLADGTGNPGDVYECTVQGSVNFGSGSISFAVGDFVVYGANGKWYNSPNTFPTKVVVPVSATITLNNTHNGKTLRFTGVGITVNVPSGLPVNFEVFLDNDTASNIVIVNPDGTLTVFAPSGLNLVGGGTGYLTMTTSTRVSIKGDFID